MFLIFDALGYVPQYEGYPGILTLIATLDVDSNMIMMDISYFIE